MLTQKLVLSYSTKILVQVVQMATSLIVARLVGPSVLGTLAFGMAYVSMFSFIADLGVGSAHIKLISEGRNESNCNRTYATIKIFLISIFAMAVVTVFLFQKYVMHYHFESAVHEKVIVIYLIVIVISQFYNVVTANWAAKMEQAKQDIPNFIQTLLYQVLRVIIALLGYKAIALALGNLAAVIITIPIYIYLARDLKFGKFDMDLFKDYLKISSPVIIIIISQTLIYSTDKVILQYLTNSVEVGYYSAAFTLGSFIKTIEASAGLLLFPFFSKYIAGKQFDEINASLRKFERFTFTFILPMGLTFAIFSDLIINLTYGSMFVHTIPIFSIIIISFMTSLIYLPYGNIIFGMGLFKTAMLIWLVNLCTFLLVSYLLVSPALLNLKGLGMAIAILVSNFMMFAQLIFFTRIFNDKIKLLPGRFLLLYGILFFSIAFLIIHLIPIQKWYFKATALTTIYLLFLGIGSLINVIKKEDFIMVTELINLKKMKYYIQSEIFRKK